MEPQFTKDAVTCVLVSVSGRVYLAALTLVLAVVLSLVLERCTDKCANGCSGIVKNIFN